MSIKEDKYGIADLQSEMLEILKQFIKICDKNNLTYWLAAGSCLGALRHKGFIPWDDDLDVYMPRQDYEKLWAAMKDKKDERFVLCRTTKEQNYHHRVMQLADTETTFIHSRNKDEDIVHGVYIDIIPLDGCPEKPIQRFLQIINGILYSVYNIQCKPEYNGGKLTTVITIGTTILLSIVKNPESRYKIWTKAEKNMTKYSWDKCSDVKCVTGKFHALVTKFPQRWFGQRETEFENIIVSIPSCAEEYCEKMYGDYMRLPPLEEQVARHHTEYIDLNKSYMKYKGIYYCVKE